MAVNDSRQDIRPELAAVGDLGPQAMLGHLPAQDALVSLDTMTYQVGELLDERPQLPGVVVVEGNQLIGLISRDKLLEQLSRPFGLELYMRRPIRQVLDAVRSTPLVLSGQTPIAAAAQQALARPAGDIYEPLVVQSEEGQYQLLDIQTVLLAQSRLLEMANAEIQRQIQAAEAANAAKSEFLANMSHEIRTPLTAIIGFAENLLDQRYSAGERQTAVQTILRNGEHLLQVINDILDLSKIEAGQLQTERLTFSPLELVADVVSVMRVRADAKNLPLSLNFLGPLPRLITSDSTRLRQILMNLVGNAIKFTELGSVELAVSMRENENGVVFRCDVRDTGIGLLPEQLGRLFQPFTQADGSTARRFGGTGLGLSISQRLSRMLGGQILVASEYGRGSVFSVEIDPGPLDGVEWIAEPAEGLLAPSPDRQVAEATLSCRILLAEDGPDNQMLITSFLQKCGATVAVGENGARAVELAFNTRPSFDVILMDMQMPILDGLSATRELRQRGWSGPIIALTANAMEGDRQKCLSAGCDDYTTKPIDRQELLTKIQRQLLRRAESGMVSLHPPAETNGDASCNSARMRRPDLSTSSAATTIADEAFEAGSALQPAAPVPLTDVAVEAPAKADYSAPLFDRDLALSRAGGDFELAKELARMLVDLCPQWLRDLEAKIAAGDQPTARRLAHSLKNSCENVGALVAAPLAFEIEQLAKDNQLSAAASAFPRCHQAVTELLADLTKHFEL